ncbi:MAG TPA: hypothetical protein VF403_02040 [Kofleriaceae bacterium]
MDRPTDSLFATSGGKHLLLAYASIVEQPEGELLYMMCGVASNPRTR